MSARVLVVDDLVANIKLLEDSTKNIVVIMKDGKVYKNLTVGESVGH